MSGRHSHHLAAAVTVALALAGCSPRSAAPEPESTRPAIPALTAAGQTTSPDAGEINASVLIVDAADPARSRILATAGLGGLQLFDLAGARLGSTPAGDVASVDVAYGLPINGQPATVLAAVDTTDNRLRLFTFADDVLTEVGARPLLLGFAGEGVCLYRSDLDGAHYAFVVGDGGEVDQHLLFGTGEGTLDARQVRRAHVPSSVKQCVVDHGGQLYATEEVVGLWRMSASAESEVSARLVDTPALGQLEEEVGGVALYDGGPGSRWLIASDTTGGRLNVYDRDNDDAYLGSFTVKAPGSDEAIEEPGPLFATSMALGEGFPSGVLLVADENGGNHHAIVSMADVARALGRAPGTPQDPRRAPAPAVPVVSATVETAPVVSFGDASDDPAIWVHPTRPADSLVVGTDKKSGLYLYDMQGQVVHYVPDGKMNNVDLRDGFLLGGQPVTLVTASNRTDRSIAIYRLDPVARQLVAVADGVQPTGLEDPYGLCMYRSAKTGGTYVFINSGEGPLNQWELVDAGNGKVKANPVREMMFDSQTEGCVADDATGLLFINEEDVAMWRLNAEPDGGTDKTAVDTVAGNPALKDDLEGVGLYDLGDGRGYLVSSSQGNDTYAVYRREGKQEYLGSFAVVGDGLRGIDGISETDGLEVTSRNLGPGFETGAMVAQDGRNVLPVETQNYKIVPWSAIAEALGLEQRRD
jgi:3-phytase